MVPLGTSAHEKAAVVVTGFEKKKSDGNSWKDP
jgi:hypothetical protein